MIFKAIEFAAKAHSGQYRKGTKLPYIVHPLGVAKILIECDAPEYLVVAGILHDTIEDTAVTLDEIKQTFGWDIADLVEAASEPDKSDTWEHRKKHTIGMLQNLSVEAVILVLADKLDNIRAIRGDYELYGEDLWQRFNRPRDQQKWYYESLAASFTDKLMDEQLRKPLDLFKAEVARVFGNEFQDVND